MFHYCVFVLSWWLAISHHLPHIGWPIFISSLEKYPIKLLFISLQWNCVNPLYIFMEIYYQISSLQIYIQTGDLLPVCIECFCCWFFFYLLCFAEKKYYFSLLLSYCLSFPFIDCGFDMIARRSQSRPMSRGFSCMLSSRSFMVSGHVFKALIFFDWIGCSLDLPKEWTCFKNQT